VIVILSIQCPHHFSSSGPFSFRLPFEDWQLFTLLSADRGSLLLTQSFFLVGFFSTPVPYFYLLDTLAPTFSLVFLVFPLLFADLPLENYGP